MTSLRALALIAVLGAGFPSAAFAVTGRDANGVPNGTRGSLTDPKFAASRQPRPDNTGTAPALGSQNHDPNRLLGSGNGPPGDP